MTDHKEVKPRVVLGDFTLDLDDERLWGPAGEVRLGNKAFLLLSRLAEEQGRLVTKDALFSSVWDGTIVSESALTSVVKELRRALGDNPRAPRYIQSVYGRGYRLLEPVRDLAAVEIPPASSLEGGVRTGPEGWMGAAAYPPLLYVPPFEEAQLSQTNPWLGEVIREELLLALSRFRDVRLVSDAASNTSLAHSPAFGKRDYQLGIHLLDDGDGIQIFAKMARLATQEIIWADRQRLDAGKPAQDIDLLIRKIAAAALPRVYDDVVRHLPPRAEDAYGLYLQIKLAMRAADTLPEMQAVAHQLEALVKAQPGFAQAYAALIYLYNTDFGYTGLGATTDVERKRASALARKAAKIDPSEPSLHTVLAWCYLWAGEGQSAREHLQQALQLNPYHKDRLLEMATALMFLGDLDQAAELIARCETLTPFATGAPHEEAGLLNLLLGDFAKATECLRRVTEPTVSSELYALLAAGASGSPDFQPRAAEWAVQTRARWQGASPLDAASLGKWVLYHHPFQDEARREWVLQLLQPAFSSALRDPVRIPGQEHREGLSAPSADAWQS